jgi:imidazolonepropionase-like amidohydrolase
VTTARELGSYRQVDIALRNAINAGLIAGPRLICAGMYIAITGGHGHPKGRAADGPEEVRKAVREQVLAGADVIKMMCSGGAARVDESADWIQFSYEEIRAGAEEAHFAGRRLAAHAHPTVSIKWALQAGADSIEHGTYLDEECIDLMLEKQVFLVPTLAVYARIAHSEQPAALKQRSSDLYHAKVRTLQRALERGVRIAVGTDSSAFFPIESYVTELNLLVSEAGLTQRDVLLLATRGNAELLKIDGAGRIEPGALADLVVVGGDPTENLEVLRDVTLTVRNGAILDWRTAAEPLGLAGAATVGARP